MYNLVNMADKKRKYRDCYEERRVELLKKYYEFDEATKTFDIVLHFEKASDIFNERYDLLKKRIMKEEIVEEAARLISDVPKGYKAELSLVIDDYEDIHYEEILEAFHNVLDIRLIRFKGARRRKYHKVAILVLIGMSLIALMILGEVMRWWGGETMEGRLLSYFLDTAGCVLIWEGLYSALLERTPDGVLGYALSQRLSAIGLYHNDDSDEALASERNGEVVMIERDKLGKKAGSTFLYLSGFFLVGAGVIGVMLRAPLLANIIAASGELALVIALLEIVSSFFLCGLGFLAIKMFNENYRYFILTVIATVVVLGLVILSFVSLFLRGTSPAHIISSVASLAAMILYVIGFGLSTYHHHKDIARTIRRGKAKE